jgi:hypothetical protein
MKKTTTKSKITAPMTPVFKEPTLPNDDNKPPNKKPPMREPMMPRSEWKREKP